MIDITHNSKTFVDFSKFNSTRHAFNNNSFNNENTNNNNNNNDDACLMTCLFINSSPGGGVNNQSMLDNNNSESRLRSGKTVRIDLNSNCLSDREILL